MYTIDRPLSCRLGAVLAPSDVLVAELARVADALAISPLALTEPARRGRRVLRARRVAAYYLFVHCDLSEQQIAAAFGRSTQVVRQWLRHVRDALGAAHLSPLDDVLEACAALYEPLEAAA